MNMKQSKKHFLTLLDYSSNEIEDLLALAQLLKREKKEGKEIKRLLGKNIALIFEKSSTRTRCAFEVAAYDQGAHVTYLGPEGSQIGHKESIKDTARVLGRMYDAIQYRGYGQHVVEELARYAGVPVINGLTNEFHPTQALADVLTIMEHVDKPLGQINICFIGDAANNVCNSLMVISAKLGMSFRACAPKECQPKDELVQRCKLIAEQTNASILISDNLDLALKDCDVIYTDVWVSMGEPDTIWKERIRLLSPYQVNAEAIEKTGNASVLFMHCLPAFHDTNTKVSAAIYQQFVISSMEVTDEVFESEASVVFDQAENRLHTIKAILVHLLQN